MRFFACCFFSLLFLSFVSCGPHKVCSGLNPEIGKYNTSKKMRKGGHKLSSGPEKAAHRRRVKQMQKKRRKKGPGKSVPLRRRFIKFNIGGGGNSGGGTVSGSIGGGNDNKQQQKR
jgi:hypothetical protein